MYCQQYKHCSSSSSSPLLLAPRHPAYHRQLQTRQHTHQHNALRAFITTMTMITSLLDLCGLSSERLVLCIIPSTCLLHQTRSSSSSLRPAVVMFLLLLLLLLEVLLLLLPQLCLKVCSGSCSR
jgi:hypothetical protein